MTTTLGHSTARLRRVLLAAACPLLLITAVGGCDTGGGRGMMVAIPPPDGWVDSLEESRAAKDERFVEDPETPLLPEDVDGFQGLDYWEPDPAYYFVGPVNLYLEPERFTIVTTTGKERPCEKVGWIGFRLGEQELRLQVYRLLDSPPAQDDPGYFLPFMDGTTGRESYPSGRYVDLVGPMGGPYLLDFNTAYNPLCAYGAPERYVCPVTPRENRLPVRIEAGERGYRRKESGS